MKKNEVSGQPKSEKPKETPKQYTLKIHKDGDFRLPKEVREKLKFKPHDVFWVEMEGLVEGLTVTLRITKVPEGE